MFILTTIARHFIFRENAHVSRVLHKFTELLTTTQKCLISSENTFLTALGFTRCGMVGAFQGYHKAIKYISAVVAEILPQDKQTVSFIDCQDGSPSIIEIVARRIKRK